MYCGSTTGITCTVPCPVPALEEGLLLAPIDLEKTPLFFKTHLLRTVGRSPQVDLPLVSARLYRPDTWPSPSSLVIEECRDRDTSCTLELASRGDSASHAVAGSILTGRGKQVQQEVRDSRRERAAGGEEQQERRGSRRRGPAVCRCSRIGRAVGKWQRGQRGRR